ncbi:transposase [Streptomyces sp. NPDC051665]|uniref:transposase n=1 Tax=Streptomyces sp. NPDC051665 TaxID=3154647 RepID=UPI003422A1D6
MLFADRVGIRSDQITGRTWGEKGRTPTVRRTGNRFSVNAMSAISTKGRMHFMVFTETFDADVMCRFLDRLAGHLERKVHLVLDGHSARRSRKVRAWLAARPDRIELPPAAVPARAEPGRAGQHRPQTEPAHPPRPGPTRRRNPRVLPPASTSATHRPRLLRRLPRALHPRMEPFEFRINSATSVDSVGSAYWAIVTSQMIWSEYAVLTSGDRIN